MRVDACRFQVNRTSTGKSAWHVVGVSEIVRDQDAIFLEAFERVLPATLRESRSPLSYGAASRRESILAALVAPPAFILAWPVAYASNA